MTKKGCRNGPTTNLRVRQHQGERNHKGKTKEHDLSRKRNIRKQQYPDKVITRMQLRLPGRRKKKRKIRGLTVWTTKNGSGANLFATKSV